MSEVLKRRMRCAVYTRKSSEEGLDQEYNSIDAQRDAGQLKEAACRLPPAQGHHAGAKLPLHLGHTKSRQQRHWPQP